MQKQTQLPGERKWWGSDWIMIQDELYKVLEAWLGQYGQACILSGCEVSGSVGSYDISAGIILIKDAGGNYQYAQFAGTTGASLPGFLVIDTSTTSILYEDGNTKVKLITNNAIFQTSPPADDYIIMEAVGGLTWRDVIGMIAKVSIGALASGHAVKFDKDYSELFTGVAGGAIHITFDFTNAIPGAVTRMRFTLGGGNTLIVDNPAGSVIIKDDGDETLAPGAVNVMYFIYAGINNDGDHEVSYTLKQPV